MFVRDDLCRHGEKNESPYISWKSSNDSTEARGRSRVLETDEPYNYTNMRKPGKEFLPERETHQRPIGGGIMESINCNGAKSYLKASFSKVSSPCFSPGGRELNVSKLSHRSIVSNSAHARVQRRCKVSIARGAVAGENKHAQHRSRPQNKVTSPHPTALKKVIWKERNELVHRQDLECCAYPHLKLLFGHIYESSKMALNRYRTAEKNFIYLNVLFLAAGVSRNLAPDEVIQEAGKSNGKHSQNIKVWALQDYYHSYPQWIDQRTSTRTNREHHVRKYVDHILSNTLDTAIWQLLDKLHDVQQKLKKREPLKVKSHLRYVVGLKQALKFVEINRAKLIILAPDIESLNVLNQMHTKIIAACSTHQIPYVYSLSSNKLREVCRIPRNAVVSAVTICSADGAHEILKKVIVTELPALRRKAFEWGLETGTAKEK